MEGTASSWHNYLKPHSDQVERHGMTQLWGHRNSSSMSGSSLSRHSAQTLKSPTRKVASQGTQLHPWDCWAAPTSEFTFQ